MLSTDETEVRNQIEIIEQIVKDRASSRYNSMVSSGKPKEDLFKMAK